MVFASLAANLKIFLASADVTLPSEFMSAADFVISSGLSFGKATRVVISLLYKTPSTDMYLLLFSIYIKFRQGSTSVKSGEVNIRNSCGNRYIFEGVAVRECKEIDFCQTVGKVNFL